VSIVHVIRLNHTNPTILYSAALTGGFVDRIAETKGMDELDKERAKHAGAFLDLLNYIY